LNKLSEDLRRFDTKDGKEDSKVVEEEKDEPSQSRLEDQAGKEVSNPSPKSNNFIKSDGNSNSNSSRNESDQPFEKEERSISEGNGEGPLINKPRDFNDEVKQVNILKYKDLSSSSFIDTRTGALKAWDKENLAINSPIKDLFAGLTSTTVI
jgi:hypothetical protein